MGRPKRSIVAAAEESLNPPDELTPSQSIARVVKAEGNNLYTCELPNKKIVLLELEQKFRNAVWIKRGGYVLVDLGSVDERKSSSKVAGEIRNVVRDERLWRKQPYWPKEFPKKTYDDSDEDNSTAGKLPPGDSSEAEEEDE